MEIDDIFTEGDVEGIMDRPTGDSMEAQAEREKWYCLLFKFGREREGSYPMKFWLIYLSSLLFFYSWNSGMHGTLNAAFLAPKPNDDISLH